MKLGEVEPLSPLEVAEFLRKYFGQWDDPATSALEFECIEASDDLTRALATLAQLSEARDFRQ